MQGKNNLLKFTLLVYQSTTAFVDLTTRFQLFHQSVQNTIYEIFTFFGTVNFGNIHEFVQRNFSRNSWKIHQFTKGHFQQDHIDDGYPICIPVAKCRFNDAQQFLIFPNNPAQ